MSQSILSVRARGGASISKKPAPIVSVSTASCTKTVVNGHHGGEDGERGVEDNSYCSTQESTCCDSFREHWRQMQQLIESEDHVKTETADMINSHFQHMISLLFDVLSSLPQSLPHQSEPANSSEDLPAILHHLLNDSVLEQLLFWSRGPTELHVRQLQQMQLLQLVRRLLESEWRVRLMHVTSFVRLLEQLLGDCCGSECCRPSASQYDSGHQLYTWHRAVVMLIDRVFSTVSASPSLLSLILPVDSGGAIYNDAIGPVAVVLLVRYLHCDGVLGGVSRDTLLSLVRLSTSSNQLATLLLHCSDFCVMLAAGLGGLYSSLPRVLELFPEGSYRQLRPDCRLVPQLHSLVRCLEFCDAILASCTADMQSRLLELIYQAFLVPVLCPALMEGTIDEKTTSVSYLQQFLLVARQKCLIRLFLQFIVCHETDNKPLLNCLLQHLSVPTKLCVVTLSLFHTILDFNCEDVLLALVVRHLLPAAHVMVSERRRSVGQQLHGLLAGADQLLTFLPIPLDDAGDTRALITHECHRRVAECHVVCANSFSRFYQNAPYSLSPLASSAAGDICQLDTAVPAAISTAPAEVVGGVDETESRVPAAVASAGVTCDDDACSLGGSSSGYQSFNLRCSPSPPPPLQGEQELFDRLMQQCPSPSGDWRALSLGEVAERLDAELQQWSPVGAGAADGEAATPNGAGSRGEGGALSAGCGDAGGPAESSDPPYIGPFLSALFALLCHADRHSLDVNVQLMCLLSRLCLFPVTPLLSFLLDSTVTLQPCVPSLFQALAVLKVRVDTSLAELHSLPAQLQRTEAEMIARTYQPDAASLQLCSFPGGRLGVVPFWASARAEAIISSDAPVNVTTTPRRSFTSSLGVMAAKIVGSFGRSPIGGSSEPIRLSKINNTSSGEHTRLLQTVVLLEHWLFELAAIAREHALTATIASSCSSP